MWVLYSAICHAGEKEDKAIAQISPQVSAVDSSVGIIEGKKYLAALVYDENEYSTALVVFELDQSGGYKLCARSGGSGLDHQRWYEKSVKIKNNSVYLSVRGNGGCCSNYYIQYQFKPKNGKFTLVGVESSETGIESKNDNSGIAIDGEYISYSYGSSINYLAGVVGHWRIQAPSSSKGAFKDDISTIKTGKKRVENRLNFISKNKVLLEGFDVWNYSNAEPKQLGGYFDQNFKYHEQP
jgi:hypothetical protein